MTAKQFAILMQKWRNRSITSEELEAIGQALESGQFDEYVSELLEEHLLTGDLNETVDVGDKDIVLQRILSSRNEDDKQLIDKQRYFIKPWLKYAAAIIVVLSTTIALWLRIDKSHSVSYRAVENIHDKNDIAPGTDQATLKLGDGTIIVLDSAHKETLALQGNGRILQQEGLVQYKEERVVASVAEVVYNTVVTPRGGQYRLILADGTKVWLDAASSITFPTVFSGTSRRVKMTGQAYFEVQHDRQRPFEVDVQGQVVRDLGTEFNIKAYSDEPDCKVTLFSGLVAVGIPGKELLLRKAGEQIGFNETGLGKIVNSDLSAVGAWKNGTFHLASATVESVLRDVSRWYNVDVEYVKGIPSGHITGEISRNTKLSVVIRALQTSGVNLNFDGIKIRVLP